jgi:uncharacterized protein
MAFTKIRRFPILNELILSKLQKIERDQQVKLLLAVESGSRAWGFPARDSDYDVRFIYVHHPDWYLSIDEKRDTIELPASDTLDLSGWDIRKALKLYRKSNPPLMEWLASNVIYCEKVGFRQEMAAEHFLI